MAEFILLEYWKSYLMSKIRKRGVLIPFWLFMIKRSNTFLLSEKYLLLTFLWFNFRNQDKFVNILYFVKIHIELPIRDQTCAHCKAKTTKIKNYKTQIIYYIPIRFKTTLLSYRMRRYECKECGKHIKI